MQAVLEVELPLPLTQWGNRSPKNVESSASRPRRSSVLFVVMSFTELDDARRDVGPVLCRDEPVVGIAGVADGLENHPATIGLRPAEEGRLTRAVPAPAARSRG